jgi:hypothetical protein
LCALLLKRIFPKLILYISFPGSKIIHFSKEKCFFLLDNGIRNQDPVAMCSHCFSHWF